MDSSTAPEQPLGTPLGRFDPDAQTCGGRCPHGACGADRAGAGCGRHGHTVEPERSHLALRHRGAAAERVRSAHGDGAGRRLRRRECDRRRPRGLPAHLAGGDADGLQGRGDCDRGVQDAPQHRSGSGAGADGALQRLACGHRGRRGQDTRHRGGQRRGGSDDRRANSRRSLRDAGFPDRHDAGSLAARAAGVRQRPECVGQGREAVPDQEGFAVPFGRAVRADEPQVRTRVRRGQDGRLGFGPASPTGRSIRRTPRSTGPRTRRGRGTGSSTRSPLRRASRSSTTRACSQRCI